MSTILILMNNNNNGNNWKSSSNEAEQQRRRLELLNKAKEAAEYAYTSCNNSRSSSSSFRVSLLEGKQIGALCLLAAINNQLGITNNDQTKYTPTYIVSLLDAATSRQNLPPSECEVLYGRAGTIQAILFLRQELHEITIGRDLVVRLAIEILEEGKTKGSNQFPLLWEWYDEIYLGPAHGIVGILQTLLTLVDGNAEEWHIIEQRVPEALQLIEQSMRLLMNNHPALCHESGNLRPCFCDDANADDDDPDRLVHWCHGAPGLVLLWIKSAKVFSSDRKMYLGYAKKAAEIVWQRGLLRKGIGLCHGISGNGIILARLATTLEVESDDEYIQWRNRSFQYAHFAISHLHDLEHKPDRPYSLFEGLGGLVYFLLQCGVLLDEDGKRQASSSTNIPTNGKESLLTFPLYEYDL